MTELVTEIPSGVWQQTLLDHASQAVFWHEMFDEESGHYLIALVRRDVSEPVPIRDYHFEFEEDADCEASRLNGLLGYTIPQMVRLKCGHLNREQGEPIVFAGAIPNCEVGWYSRRG